MSDTGKCATKKAIANCKDQGKLCNVDTGRCVAASPAKKKAGAVYDKKKSLYYPQGLSFESDDGTSEVVLPKKKRKSPAKKAKRSPSPPKKTKKRKTPSPAKKTTKKKAPAKKVSKKEACYDEGGECPPDKPYCSISAAGRGTCAKGTAKSLATKSVIKNGKTMIIGSEDVLEKLRDENDHLAKQSIRKWKASQASSSSSSESSSEEEKVPSPPKKKRIAKRRAKSPKRSPSPKRRSPSPKRKSPSPKRKSPAKKAIKKKAKIQDLLCFEEEAEQCADDQLCSATGKCVPETKQFLRGKSKVLLNDREVYGTKLQFESLAKKYSSVSKAKRYGTGEKIVISSPARATSSVKNVAADLEDVLNASGLGDEAKEIVAEAITDALGPASDADKGKKLAEEEYVSPSPKVKRTVKRTGKKEKQVAFQESAGSKGVEKSVEQIQRDFESCLGVQVRGA